MCQKNNHQAGNDIRLAKKAHEWFILNLIVTHLLAAPAIIIMDVGLVGLFIPVTASLILYSVYRLIIKRLPTSPEWVISHWRKAIKRFHILFVSYAAVAASFTVIINVVPADSIVFVALSRVIIMPAVVTVFVVFVLENSSLGNAGKSELA